MTEFWQDKRVLVTGHTGFKGAWATRWLAKMGANVHGLSLPPETDPSLFVNLGQAHLAQSHLIDLRHHEDVAQVVKAVAPQVVLHMAAQPIVRTSYDDPVGTFSSNILGSVHLLDALRNVAELETVLVVTSDKVYTNDDHGRPFVESDALGGDDPYSASKAATEIVVSSMAKSFFEPRGIAVATARGGNVIGGGDFSKDRLVPDIVRAAEKGDPLVLRNPNSTRPWQHVLDCLSGYFRFAEALQRDPDAMPRILNFGPSANDPPLPTGELAQRVQVAMGLAASWKQDTNDNPAEKAHLSIDASKSETVLGWVPKLNAEETVDWTAQWYAGYLNGDSMTKLTDTQIDLYQEKWT